MLQAKQESSASWSKGKDNPAEKVGDGTQVTTAAKQEQGMRNKREGWQYEGVTGKAQEQGLETRAVLNTSDKLRHHLGNRQYQKFCYLVLSATLFI